MSVVSHTRFSVVLPTLNGAKTLPALLEDIWAQRTVGSIEVIAVDSGSTDDTLDILKRRATDIITITPDQFDHGMTRNLAIARARGDFIVLLVQDARLIGRHFFDALSRPFEDEPTLAGTFARQRARTDASPLTRHYLDYWVASSYQPWRSDLRGGAAEFEAMAPLDRLSRCAFDNVGACIRRSVWEQHPFRPTPIAEDLEWAKEVLLNGYTLEFVPEAVVEHSHDRTAGYEYDRTRLLHARLYELFGIETIPDIPALARSVMSTLATHCRLAWREPARWRRAAGLAFAFPFGQYMGARLARAGDTRPRGKTGRV